MSERVTIVEVGELESRCRYGTEPASLMLLALRVARAFLVLARAAAAAAAWICGQHYALGRDCSPECHGQRLRAALPEGEEERGHG